ncbi:hypothetical protein [Pseudomonas sp. ML96]|uniref:hypothetical protein n=1 Tax=Pseudomonas sp. ML96 TaxID=1523503 RepID=UPI0005BD16AE|nr:hypothetical protein [Pseudomonas sp. ML96]
MNSYTKRVIEHCTNALNYGGASLVQIIGKLGEVGIESCHVDYRIPALIFYAPSGASYSLPLSTPEEPIATGFDCPALQNALDAANSGDLGFAEFKRCTLEAGCIGFFIWLDGWHATFLGRHGEIHDAPLAGGGQVLPGH